MGTKSWKYFNKIFQKLTCKSSGSTFSLSDILLNLSSVEAPKSQKGGMGGGGGGGGGVGRRGVGGSGGGGTPVRGRGGEGVSRREGASGLKNCAADEEDASACNNDITLTPKYYMTKFYCALSKFHWQDLLPEDNSITWTNTGR